MIIVINTNKGYLVEYIKQQLANQKGIKEDKELESLYYLPDALDVNEVTIYEDSDEEE